MHGSYNHPGSITYDEANTHIVRLLIADSSQFICDAMRNVLAQQQDVYIAGCARNEEQLTFLLPHSNVVLLSAVLDGRSASSIIGNILEAHPSVKVLIVGAHEGPENILRYFEAGATGYVLKGESVESLLAKVRAAGEGKALVSPELAAQLARRLADVANEPAAFRAAQTKLAHFDALTAREREVLHQISAGLTNQEIADGLFISYGTVKNHVHHILKKLGAHSRREAAMLYKAQRNGTTDAALR